MGEQAGRGGPARAERTQGRAEAAQIEAADRVEGDPQVGETVAERLEVGAEVVDLGGGADGEFAGGHQLLRVERRELGEHTGEGTDREGGVAVRVSSRIRRRNRSFSRLSSP